MSGENVAANTLDALLDRLSELRCRFEQGDSLSAQKLLVQLGRRLFPDAVSLIRFHEILLFLRAYPHTPAIRQSSEELLASFHKRVTRLRDSGADISAFADPSVSGIAGTAFSAIWGYDIVRYLAARYPSQVEIDWDDYDNEERLIAVLKSFLPLFNDGAYVLYQTPYLDWIRAAKRPNETDLAWLLRQFEQLSIDERLKADLFDSLKLWVHWKLGNSPATRTRMRVRVSRTFYHHGPSIKRSEVSLAQELENQSPLPLKKLSRADGQKLVSLGRDMMTVRYRELHGFTYGDPRHVLRAAAGRGAFPLCAPGLVEVQVHVDQAGHAEMRRRIEFERIEGGKAFDVSAPFAPGELDAKGMSAADPRAPPLSVASLREKKCLNSNRPRGVAMYLLLVTRQTVDSCRPSSPAISLRVNGFMATSPYSKKPRWRATMASATRWMVAKRCSIERSSQRASCSCRDSDWLEALRLCSASAYARFSRTRGSEAEPAPPRPPIRRPR